MNCFRGLRVLIFALLILVCALTARAQEATIVGTIMDPSGAVVPAAAVTVTNTGTNGVHKFTSGDNGQYVVPDLIPGHYAVRVEAPGFKAEEKDDLVLAVGDRTRADFTLQIGSATESIKVEAPAVGVQTDSGELSDVITGQQVTQLATNGRSVFSLAVLVPGAVSRMPDFQTPTAVGANSDVSFNGMRQAHNIWLIDGGEDDDRGGGGGMNVMPSMDAIAEFRALTSNYGADYGLSSAGTMSMVFKSGTKDFHGALWEFVKNEDFDAGNYFNNAARLPSPILRLNTYGFNVGGPVTLGRLYNKDRNKTFFFYNMEWRKMLQGGNVNQPVPLASEYPTANGAAITSTSPIHTPYACQIAPQTASQYASLGLSLSGCTNGQPDPLKQVLFRNNTIPAALISPNAVALLNAGIYPKPNNGASNFVGGNKLPTNVREEIVRIDHQFSDKFSVFGHYLDDAANTTTGTSMWSGSNVPTVSTLFQSPSRSAVVHATYAVSPTLLTETAFNYNSNTLKMAPTGLFQAPGDFTFHRLFSDPNQLNRIPGIYLSGSTGTAYDVNQFPWSNTADDYQIREDVSWTKGAHQLKMGGSWALYRKAQEFGGDTQGQFYFNGNYSGNDFADFLLGYANNYNELAYQATGHWDNVSWAAYAQDNWRVNSHLTLNLGLRWDGVPHTYEANNQTSNFYPNLYNPADAAVLLPNGTISPTSPGLTASPVAALAGVLFYTNGVSVGGVNGIPRGLVKDSWLNFAPRIGFAYDLSGRGKTVLRGGIGVMYERYQSNDMLDAAENPPFSSSVSLSAVSLTNPGLSLQTGQAVTAPITVSGLSTLSLTDYHLPVTYQYSLGVQQQLGPDSVLSVAYVGNQSRHQEAKRNINLPNQSLLPALISGTTQYNNVVPYLGYGALVEEEMGLNGHYNALQTSLKWRRNGLTLQASYTLSRAIDPAIAFGGDNNPTDNPYNRGYDYGPSQADQTHTGVVSFVYDLPIFKITPNRVLKTALGGWEVAAIGIMESGQPLYMTLGGPQGSNGLPWATNRPNFSGNISYPQSVGSWFSTTGFSLTAPGVWGDLKKGAIRGPGRDNWNISLFKSFLLNETRGIRFELRVETYNTFNHTQFNNVSTSFSSGNFGQVTSVWDPRSMQFGGKFIF